MIRWRSKTFSWRVLTGTGTAQHVARWAVTCPAPILWNSQRQSLDETHWNSGSGWCVLELRLNRKELLDPDDYNISWLTIIVLVPNCWKCPLEAHALWELHGSTAEPGHVKAWPGGSNVNAWRSRGGNSCWSSFLFGSSSPIRTKLHQGRLVLFIFNFHASRHF